MAVFDTHKAYTAFKEAGFTDAQALINQARDGSDSLATKADLRELELRLRHDLTLRLGAMVFAAAGLQVVVIGILLASFGS
ncbi:MAG: DUF1640 domain-containing protein [Chloroflexi bacterium]|nr:DUF1640 domain-containing protein [Chloroflexota bacterium]